MGIQGLIPLVSSASIDININQLNGLVAVIDAYGWIHRACYGCADQIFCREDTDKYVVYCLNRAQMLIKAGIKPILVFDGQNLSAKESTDLKRKITRHNTRQKINLLLSEGNQTKAKELMRTCVEVTYNMAKKVINALRDNGIDYIVSPFEADAQMAYLVNNGFADFVITEDSDLLVYKCRLCFFKLDSNGNGKLVDLSLLSQCLGNNFDSDKFRHMCILSGCDYLPNLPGIGLQKAKKFFKMTADNDLKKILFKVPNYLQMTKRVKITQEYVDDFIRADNTFKYQLVFCPLKRKLVPLTPYENDISIEDLKYAGIYFSDDLSPDFAYQFAIGNVDIHSLKVIDSYEYRVKCDSIWSKDWINYKKNSYSNKFIDNKFNSKVSNKCLSNEKSDSHVKQTSNSEKSFKRLKVDENRFVTRNELLKEYSNEDQINGNKLNESVYSSKRRETFSRNIFKVVNNRTEDHIMIQSKYFADFGFNSTVSSNDNKDVRNTNVVLTQNRKEVLNSSQYSLNSSGNTTINSSFADIYELSDSERSEISETSDEEKSFIKTNVEINETSFTNIKSQNNNSIKRYKPLNISFNSPKRANISNYFK